MVNMEFIGMAAALTLSALGSGIGAGIASMAAVGGWKKCYVENKPAPSSWSCLPELRSLRRFTASS